jgi:hypothetical protein
MGGGQPYLYGPPQSFNQWDPYNCFNPKAVSQSSLKPRVEKPKQDGPLLNFNRHPDSFLITPTGQTEFKKMHPNTKNRVKYARRAQLFFRGLQLIGCVGLLVAVICIKNIKGAESWIVRLSVSSYSKRSDIISLIRKM